MTLSLAGTIGAITTILGACTALVVAFRKSKSESDDSWQARVREQLEWQIRRNNDLLQRVEQLEQALAAERDDRRRTEAEMRSRIIELEARLRAYES